MTVTADQPLSGFEVYQEFHGYNLYNVYGRTTPEIRALVVDLWSRNKILSRDTDPDARAAQVGLMAVSAAGELVGVNTIYVGQLDSCGMEDPTGAHYFFYRMFIQSKDRRPEMMRVMTNGAYDLLKMIERSNKPKGMVIVAENLKLSRPGMQKMFAGYGYSVIGKDSSNRLIICRNF